MPFAFATLVGLRSAAPAPLGASEFIVPVPARGKLIVGVTTLARELAPLALRLHYGRVVVDPRPAFATRERLGAVDETVIARPDEALPAMLSERTPLVVISHDPKHDLPALRRGLESAAPYIGSLRGRRAQEARLAALQTDGFSEAALKRIRGPAGLDLGGVSIAETAVWILGETVTAHSRPGGSLLRHSGAIHNLVEPNVVDTQRIGEPV